MLLSLSVMAILDEESDRKIVVGLRFRAKANRTLWNTNKYITVVYHVAEHISKKQFTWSELWQKFLQLLLQFSGDFIPFSCGFFFFSTCSCPFCIVLSVFLTMLQGCLSKQGIEKLFLPSSLFLHLLPRETELLCCCSEWL